MSAARFPLSERGRRWFSRRVLDPIDRLTVAPYRRLKNSSRQYRPVFVAGAMGSGTTLLALSLAQQVECAAVIDESALRVRRSSFLRVQPPARFGDVGSFLEHLRESSDWSAEEGRADLLDLYRSCANGKGEVVIDKGPNTNLLRAEFLVRCFPEGRFILLFRDPIANIEGLRRKWPNFRSDSLAASIDFYREIHEGFFSSVRDVGDRVAAVEYEALIEDPERVLATLREKFFLPPATTRRRLKSRGNFEGQGIRNVHQNKIHIVRDANSRARSRLDREFINQIREALGPLYQRMRDRAAASGLTADDYRDWIE